MVQQISNFIKSFADFDVKRDFVLDKKEAAEARKCGYTWATEGMSETVFNAHLSLRDKIFLFKKDECAKIDKKVEEYVKLAETCKDPVRVLTYLKLILDLKGKLNEEQFKILSEYAKKVDNGQINVPYKTGLSNLF